MTIAPPTTGTPTVAAIVERERRHLRRAELASALLRTAGTAALLLGAAAMALGGSRWLTLPRALPFAVWALLVGATALMALHARRRLRRNGSRAGVAGAIEREQGLRRGLLVGALELEGQGPLAARAASAVRASLPHGAPLAPALRRDSSRRAATGGGVALSGALVLATATPLFGGDGLRAVLRPIDAWRGALLERPSIEHAPRELVRGAPLAVQVHAPGRRVVFLHVRQTGEPWRTDTLIVDPGSGARSWTLPALRGDVSLVATDGRATSDSVVVHAVDRPFVGAVSLHVAYPGYLARPPEALPVGEPLRLPRGSVLSIAGRASVPLSAVTLTDGARGTFALAPAGHTFTGRVIAERSAQLRWAASGPGGPVADLPPTLELDVIPDSTPAVAITAPAGDTILATDDRAALALSASDDHGIASIALRLTRGDGTSTVQRVADAVGASWAGPAAVDVAALQLRPGDAVRVRAEAVDVSPWAQRGVSRELVIRRATAEEQRGAARALGDAAVKEARALASAERSLAQRTDEAARAPERQGASRGGSESGASPAPSAPQKGTMKYESAEKSRALAAEQRAMADRVQKLRDATAQLQQQLRAAGALDSSLARQLSDAQALLRQALTPQMQAQMQKLEGATGQMNGEQSREALRDLAQMQQRMREQLERSAEMLKRAAHEGSMQTLGDQARELAAKERALGDSAGQRSAGEEQGAARQASQLAAQTERLRDQMESLKDRLSKDRAEAGASRTGQAQEHAAKSETGMRRAANELQTGVKAQAGSPGEGSPRERSGGERSPGAGTERAREAAAEMDRAASAMQEARAAQVKEWKQELTSELDRSVQEMMQLAREERTLEQQARASSAPSDDRRGAQSAVEQGVDKASERLQGAGKKSALLSPRSQRAVSDARSKVAQATRQVSEAKGARGEQAGALGDAADALTKAAASLARDRERANGAGSASGFGEMLQQLQEAAEKQGRINSQAQGLMNLPNGAGGSGQSLARSLAQQQRGVADQLEDAGDAAGGDRAAQLAKEARQLAEALDGGRMDAATLARQQQLFRRLLDAGRTLQKEEREDSGKREATSALGGEAFTPAGKVDARAATRFRMPTWEELRGLSADERRAIVEYFARLNGSAPKP